MKRHILTTLSIVLAVGTVHAETANIDRYPFLPETVQSNNDPLCSVIRDTYIERFKSDETGSSITRIKTDDRKGLKLDNAINHPDLQWAEWERVDSFSGTGTLYTSDSYNSPSSSIFALHTRKHSWRGNIFTVYYINADSLPEFAKHLSDGKAPNQYPIVYPAGSPRHGSNWSWRLNNLFLYKSSYYFIDETGTFNRRDGLRKVYRADDAGTTEVVCELSIYPTTDEIIPEYNLNAYASFLKSINFIHGPGNDPCDGTLNSHARSANRGREASLRAIIRPWIESGASYRRSYTDKQTDRFLNDWGLSDIWNLRQYQTSTHYADPVRHELSRFYADQFGLSDQVADDMALSKARDVLQSFLVIPSSYEEFRPSFVLNHLSSIADGKGLDRAILDNELKDIDPHYRGDKSRLLLQAAQMSLDTPKQLDEFFEVQPYSEMRNAFGKTLLMYAAHINNYGAVKFLIDYGVEVNQGTERVPGKRYCQSIPRRLNRTALHYAAENASFEILDLLIDAGADLTARDSKGYDVNHYFQKNPRFTETEKAKGMGATFRKYIDKDISFTPSFDCSQASSNIEKTVCSSKTLSIYDRELGNAYLDLLAKGGKPDFDRRDQRRWLSARNKECGKLQNNELRTCLAQKTRARTRYMHSRLENK